MQLLLVDDEPTIRLTVGDQLRHAGYHVELSKDGAQATKILSENTFDVVLTDVRLPKLDGHSLLDLILEQYPDTDVILMTAYADVADAVGALKKGARDYLSKPFEVDELLIKLNQIAEKRTLHQELKSAREQLDRSSHSSLLIGESAGMRSLKKRIQTIARSDAPVLITGESGTGKELIARELHRMSDRSDGPFVAVNCAGLPESLLESELFGHERGAFTGADRKRKGRFEAAHGGTIFLDEIGEVPPSAQVKLLRVLQEKVIERVGSQTPIVTDAWVISATNRNLPTLITEGTFREDLYYRLMVLDIISPSLRTHLDDLPILIEYFLDKYRPQNTPKPELAASAWGALAAYDYPGNVRELEHAIRHALVLSNGGPIAIDHLPRQIGQIPVASSDTPHSPLPLHQAVRIFEHEYISKVLRQTDGKKAQAAELLGISRKNLWEKLKNFEASSHS